MEPLKIAGIVTAAIGGVVSEALLLNAARSTPIILLVMFIAWVGLPYALLVIGNLYTEHRKPPDNKWTFPATLTIAMASMTIYLYYTLRPLSSTPARTWLLVPGFSILGIMTLAGIAFLTRRAKRSWP